MATFFSSLKLGPSLPQLQKLPANRALWARYSGTAVPQLLARQATGSPRHMSTTHLTFPEHHTSHNTQMEEPTCVRADSSTLLRNTAFVVGTETSLCPPCFPLRPSEGWCWAGGTRENNFPRTPGIHYRNYPQALIFLETKPIASFPEGLAASPLQLRELTPGLLI